MAIISCASGQQPTTVSLQLGAQEHVVLSTKLCTKQLSFSSFGMQNSVIPSSLQVVGSEHEKNYN